MTVLILRRSILTEKLARRGQHIAREYSVDVFELTRVGDVMDRNPTIVPGDLAVAALSDRIACGDPAVSRRQGMIVADRDGRLLGIVTRGDLMRSLQQDPAGAATVGEIAHRDVVVTRPDETVGDALTKMLERGIGRLPVVDPADPGRIVGYLGRAEVLATRMRAYEEEAPRKRRPAGGTRAPRPATGV